MKNRMVSVLLVSVALSPWSNRLCHASIVYDNGNHIGNGRFSLAANPRSADNFVIAAGATITDVHWKGFYSPASAPLPTDNFVINFYAHNSTTGLPATAAGSPIYTAPAGSLTRVATGETISVFNVYGYSAVIPAFVAAPGTTYWLEILNNIGPGIGWAWTMDSNVGNSVVGSTGGAWIALPEEYTFQLTNDFSGGVPEASTLAIWSVLSTLGLLVAKRKLGGAAAG